MRWGAALTANLAFPFGLLRACRGPAIAFSRPGKVEGQDPRQAQACDQGFETKQEAPKPAPQPAPSAVMPDAEKIVLLVRTTIITLNDAIQTGNFTVLRDKAAPGFREANSAARLGQIFADLTARKVDLSVTSVLSPQLTEAPVLDQAKGLLNVKGYFPTTPVQINFEMLFQSVPGRWRLFGISVQPSNAAPASSAPIPPPASPSANSDAPTSKP
jgi:hypothetical protein